jgi:hypothetical protein
MSLMMMMMSSCRYSCLVYSDRMYLIDDHVSLSSRRTTLMLSSPNVTHIHGVTSPIYGSVVPLCRITSVKKGTPSTVHHLPASHPTPVGSAR